MISNRSLILYIIIFFGDALANIFILFDII